MRPGSDPASGSGALATVNQDLLSILIYLAVARPSCPDGRCDREAILIASRQEAPGRGRRTVVVRAPADGSGAGTEGRGIRRVLE